MTKYSIIEACVSTLTEATRAQEQGADRIELCSRLDLDGLTPEIELVKSVLEILKIPVKVMVRLYNSFDSYELEDRRLIKTQLKALRSAGVRDYVFGSLKEDRLDIDDLTWFYKEIRDIPPTSLTIHKAIDASVDIIADIQLLLDSDLLALAREDGCEVAILSSGGASTAQAGTSMLNQMHAMCGNHIEIIAAGKITTANLSQHQQTIDTSAFHGRKIV